MNTWKTNWAESKQRYLDWWSGRGLLVSMWEHLMKEGDPHEYVAEPEPFSDLNQFWSDPVYRAEYLHYQLSRSSFMADILPVANTQLGPGSLGAILGGRLECRDNNIWIREPECFSGDIKLDPGNEWWQLHRYLLSACRRKSQDNYFVGMPDLMEGLDVLASLKGTDAVLMDLIIDPETTLDQLQKINDLYFKVFDELYDIIQVNGEMVFCYFSIWGPGKVAKIQCDISTMISEEDFRTFALPFLEEQCNRIDFTLYHLDGVDAIRHLDAVLEISHLNAVQWTPGYGEPQGGDPKWYPLYRKILDAGKSVMPCWVKVEELQNMLDTIGNQGIHLLMDFKDEYDIEAALKIVEKYR